MNNTKILIISILLSLVIIFLRKIMYNKNESFNTDVLSELEIMQQHSPSIQKKILFDSVDTSLDLGKGKQGKIITSNSNINQNLLDLYVNNLINTDKGNPNKTLVSDDEELPKAPNNNWEKYNHEMRILIDSKKIKQDYLIKVLKGKLTLLRNNLNTVHEVEKAYDLDKL